MGRLVEIKRERTALSSTYFSEYEKIQIAPKIRPFQINTARYEKWFEIHPYVYLSELEAIRSLLPEFSQGVEIGVGTGRFSSPFGIKNGVEPALNALKLARGKGIEVVNAVGETLPYKDQNFDLALIVTTICFFSDVKASLKETLRVLKSRGSAIVGFVDKDSLLGKMYQEMREESPFYSNANFIAANEVSEFLRAVGFQDLIFVQTVFKTLKEIKQVEPVKQGYGEGSFVVVRATKPSRIRTACSQT